MSDPAPRQVLPHSVDALKLCQQRAVVSGFVSLAMLPRLSAQLHTVEGSAFAELAFGVDEQSRRILTGRVTALLPLVCQRCLEGIAITVESEPALALVWNDEQASHLPRSLDPVLLESPELDLYTIVEDELLLAMPLVAHHESGTCVAPPLNIEQPDLDQDDDEKENPFQVLASLKSVVKDADN